MASYFPMVKNSAQRIVFPILDADGDPVTGAAADTPDSEYSLDGGSFSDITDEIHEIATSSGIYYLDLATGETNGDVVCIQVKTATAGTKTTVLVFYTAAQSLDTMDINIDDIEGYVNGFGDIVTKNEAGVVDAVWDEVLTGATHNTATSAGKRLRQAGTDVLLIREDTCQAGASASTVILDTGASGTNGFYDHMAIILTDGTGSGQIRSVHNYVGSTFTGDVSPDWQTTPDATSTYTIIAIGSVHLHEISIDGLAQINAEVDTALDTAIPESPTEDSINERIATLDDAGAGASAATIADAVWDEILSEHTTAGSGSKIAQLVLQVLKGRWQVTGNQLVIYDSDDETALYTFDLTNIAGSPSSIRVYDRTPA